MLSRLLVLWLLSESPLHGYAIKRAFEDEGSRLWFPIEFGSIYSVLATLLKQGHVRSLGGEQEGRRPRRTRYAITPSGRERFRELLERAWQDLPGSGDPLHVALAARSDLPTGRVAELLEMRGRSIRSRLDTLARLDRASPEAAIIRRLEVLSRAELQWVEDEISREASP